MFLAIFSKIPHQKFKNFNYFFFNLNLELSFFSYYIKLLLFFYIGYIRYFKTLQKDFSKNLRYSSQKTFEEIGL